MNLPAHIAHAVEAEARVEVEAETVEEEILDLDHVLVLVLVLPLDLALSDPHLHGLDPGLPRTKKKRKLTKKINNRCINLESKLSKLLFINTIFFNILSL